MTECFDGVNSWKLSNSSSISLKADEAEQIKREAELFSPANFKAIYPKMDFRFLDRIDGREVNVVTATTAAGFLERLAFRRSDRVFGPPLGDDADRFRQFCLSGRLCGLQEFWRGKDPDDDTLFDAEYHVDAPDIDTEEQRSGRRKAI